MTGQGGVPPGEVEAVAAHVAASVGVGIGDRRHGDLLAAVTRAMARAGVSRAGEFRLLLDRDPAELDALIGTLTVRESYFFREAAQVDLLRWRVLPDRTAAAGPDRGLRIWSAGCADGQEAYTMAILLEEERLRTARILATDLSGQALEVARRGVYGKWSLRAVDEDRRRRYFRAVHGGFQVDPNLAHRITFRQLNLMDDVDFGTNDVVLCRNVLVYLAPDAVERVARRLAASLAPGGWLLTASTDPYLDAVGGLTALVTPAGIVYRRGIEDGATVPRPALSVETPHPASARAATRHQEAVRGHAPASARTAKRPAPSVPPAASGATRGLDELARARLALADADHATAAEQATAAVTGGVDGEADGEARVVLVRALANAGRTAEAADAAAEAVARFPMHVELRFLYALVLLESDRPDEAVAAARAALYLEPRLAVAHLTLGRAEHARGNASAAARRFRNALALLEQLPGDEPVPLAEGERPARLAALAEAHLRGGAHPPTAQARAR